MEPPVGPLGWITAAGSVGAFFTLLAVLVRQWVPLRQLKITSDGRLIETLTARVDKLERRLESQAKSHSTHIEILRQLHEGEIALVRHRLNGEAQINIALMTVLETLDVSPKTIDAIQASRARMQESIAAEQAEMTKLRASAVERLARLTDTEE